MCGSMVVCVDVTPTTADGVYVAVWKSLCVCKTTCVDVWQHFVYDSVRDSVRVCARVCVRVWLSLISAVSGFSLCV